MTGCMFLDFAVLPLRKNGKRLPCEALQAENLKLREYAAKAWGLFIEHGAVDSCDLHEVDAVKDGLRELGVIE